MQVWAGIGACWLALTAYCWAAWLISGGRQVMRRAQCRWPAMGDLGLIMIAIGFMIFWDTVIEPFWIRTGMYHMGGGIRAITLLHGHWFSTHVDFFPAEVIDRSYFTNAMCGPGTDYACPGPTVPISVGPDSAHATPDGRFVASKGLPGTVPPAGKP